MSSKRYQLTYFALCAILLALSYPAWRKNQNSWSQITFNPQTWIYRLNDCMSDSNHSCQNLKKDLEEIVDAKIPPLDSSDAITTHASSVEEKFAKPTDHMENVMGAINKWISDKDPHAQIRPTEQLEQSASDDFLVVQGAGVKVRNVNRKLFISLVQEKSGAEEAGLQTGDRVISINGINLKRPSPQEAKKEMAKLSSPYRVEILRKNQPISILAVEKKFLLENVDFRMNGPLEGVIRVRSFTKDSTCRKMAQAIKDLESRGAKFLRIDLRDNPGGFVREAECAASLFLPRHSVFAKLKKKAEAIGIQGTTKEKGIVEAQGNLLLTELDPITKLPVKVVINHNTASAAEMVAAALQDHKRATIEGTRSFGKGTMQSVFHPWGDESLSMTQTTHLILRPSGTEIQHLGVTPDLLTAHEEGENFPREAELSKAQR